MSEENRKLETVIIVQARMTSTRLPGKILKTVLGRPLLEYQIERLRRVLRASQIVVATTTNATDDPIVELCARLGVDVFRGSEQDVLARYHGAAVDHHADIVVRITSDCPLIDPAVVDSVIEFYQENADRFDYVSNVGKRTFPRGMDTEVLPFKVLDVAFREAIAAPQREHVTPFVHRQPERFRLGNVAFRTDASRHRWTVDTPEDFALIEKMISALYPANPEFTLDDCLLLIAAHPEWEDINAAVTQKTYGN